MIVIIGAGLTGLSAAYHLKNRPYMIFEQAEKPGGLCRTTEVEKFLFDFTGHLLHMKDPQTKRFLNRILPGTFSKIFRNAAVACRDTYLPYPFQANTYGLPENVVYECVMGFVEAHMRKRGSAGSSNFRDWIVKTFGDGIAKHFFIPYNEKLWLTDLRNLTTDWADWSVPRPTLQEVIGGALGIKNTGMGYNASFYYPEKGGIQFLIDSIEKKVKNLYTEKEVVSINLKGKFVTFQDKEQVSYDTLV